MSERAENGIVGRLAPSPTGHLHLGHARSFLLAWWHARSRGGRIVLRMEDLDVPRVRRGMVDAAVRDLEWLGLDWDGPVVVQSETLPRLHAAVDRLLGAGLAYACTCTRGDLRSAASAPQAGDVEARYPGTCRGRHASRAEAETASGRGAGVRFRVPDGAVELTDGVLGARAFDVQADVGDFLIARRDHSPSYQLAVVVDDAAQGVTEIVRGDDLWPSSARQRHLQRALGLPHPACWHVPLVVDGVGRRLAKRADDLSLTELRARGIDARAVIGWAANSAGQPAARRVTAAEVARDFDIARMPREAVRVDERVVAELSEAKP